MYCNKQWYIIRIITYCANGMKKLHLQKNSTPTLALLEEADWKGAKDVRMRKEPTYFFLTDFN